MSSNRNLSPRASLEEAGWDALDMETAVPAEEAEYSLEEILAEFGTQSAKEDAEAELEALKPQPVVLLAAEKPTEETPDSEADMPENAAAEPVSVIPAWKESQIEALPAAESVPEEVPEIEPAPETEAEQTAESVPEGAPEIESTPEAESGAEAIETTQKTQAVPLLEPVKLFSMEEFENFPEAEAADIEWRVPKTSPLDSLAQAAREMRETLHEKARNVKARFSRGKTDTAESIPDIAENSPGMAEAQSVTEADAQSGTETEARSGTETDAESGISPAAKTPNAAQTDAPEGESPPVPVQVEEIVENTVDAVMAERYQVSWSPRAFFSQQDTDSLYASVSEEKEPIYAASEEAGPADISGPNLKTAANVAKAEYRKRMRDLPAALLSAIPPALFLFAEWIGLRVSLLDNNAILRAFLMLICLIASIWFCRQAFTAGRRCTSAFLCGLCAVAAGADCLVRLFSAARSPADSYGAVACLALICAKWGVSLESRGQFDTLRTAAIDKAPPYLVTAAENGARKQRGAVPGFYTFASAQNFSSRWQTLLLPLILAASLVFAALSSAGQDRPWDFFLNWSAILCAGATFTLPLCWGLPWARLARRLNNAGCAVAGWDGAEHISRGKHMVVTDQDLFPPGSIQIDGMKIYNEDLEKVVSYAASMACASGCGLQRVFDDLLRSELGHYLPVDNFQFYQEGGFSGVIGGESVLFGTESFLLKMGLHLPDHPRFHTGVFLAVQGELMAVFAVHYQAAENVDFALRLMRRGHVTAILATRDPNVTPKLLQRKFHRKLKLEFPSLASRVALSETSRKRHLPRALLFREGLLPYAEAVVGSRRLCRGVRRATLLSLFGSAAGTVLAFYLVFEGRYNLLTPLTLILFLLLWMLPALLMMELT